MHRQPLLRLLHAYTSFDDKERAMWWATLEFVKAHPDCFERSLSIGHLTGSTWIIDQEPGKNQVALIHHRKLDRWLQPGGHADGDTDLQRVALREAQEETGLGDLVVLRPAIFDIDVHTIPARGEVAEHLHYDIRFLLGASSRASFVHSFETKDIRWVPIEEVSRLTLEDSVLRMVKKVKIFNY